MCGRAKLLVSAVARSTPPLGFFLTSMKRILIVIALLMNVNSYARTDATAAFTSIDGKVFRSDKNEVIENAYILLMQEKECRVEAQHFDTRTNSEGK